MNSDMSRRAFLHTSLLAAAVAAPRKALANEKKTARVVVVKGGDPDRMLARGISEFGGWAAFVKPGCRAAVKVNAAWASRPEQGGNTDPVLAGACVAACRSAGAADVVVPEHPCNPPEQAFTTSGILKAVEDAGGRMYAPAAGDYRKTELPQARNLKDADIVADVLDADFLINIPVAKHHSGARLTLSLKNWMGSVRDRGFWHRNNLHQCIADFSTRVRPHLVVIDATRIMLTAGPRGPGELAWPNELIMSLDPVAADAYAATLFGREPFEIEHIRIAHEMGIGCGDMNRVEVARLSA